MSDRGDANFVPRSAETWRDPFTMYQALRDHDPVHEVKTEEGDYWVLSRFGDVFSAVIDAANSAAPICPRRLSAAYCNRRQVINANPTG